MNQQNQEQNNIRNQLHQKQDSIKNHQHQEKKTSETSKPGTKQAAESGLGTTVCPCSPETAEPVLQTGPHSHSSPGQVPRVQKVAEFVKSMNERKWEEERFNNCMRRRQKFMGSLWDLQRTVIIVKEFCASIWAIAEVEEGEAQEEKREVEERKRRGEEKEKEQEGEEEENEEQEEEEEESWLVGVLSLASHKGLH